jgi:hypothetical protein
MTWDQIEIGSTCTVVYRDVTDRNMKLQCHGRLIHREESSDGRLVVESPVNEFQIARAQIVSVEVHDGQRRGPQPITEAPLVPKTALAVEVFLDHLGREQGGMCLVSWILQTDSIVERDDGSGTADALTIDGRAVEIRRSQIRSWKEIVLP